MVKCGCCGSPGRNRKGCSCTGGKSHQCLRSQLQPSTSQPSAFTGVGHYLYSGASDMSTTVPLNSLTSVQPTISTIPLTSLASISVAQDTSHVKGNQAKDSPYNFYWCKLPHTTGEDHFQLQGFDSEWWYCCSCCKPKYPQHL